MYEAAFYRELKAAKTAIFVAFFGLALFERAIGETEKNRAQQQFPEKSVEI